MASARSKAHGGRAAGARRRRSAPARRTTPDRPHTRYGRQLGAIGCAALAVYVVFVLYLGWDGGRLGGWLIDGLRLLAGVLAYAAPVILGYVAYWLVAGDDRRPARAVTAGVAALSAAVALAAAADAFGVFAGERSARLFDGDALPRAGGVVGELMWLALHPAVGRLGVHVLVLALLIAGILLVAGSSLGLWARKSRARLSDAAQAARECKAAFAERRRDAATRLAGAEQDATAVLPDRAATVHQPREHYGPAVTTHTPRLIDGSEAAPEIFVAGAAHPVEDEAGAEASTGEQMSLAEAVAPEGAEADASLLAFESRAHAWQLPDAALLRPLGEGVGESPKTIEEVSARLEETLGHFGVSARVIGTVSGPRVTRYEMQLAPGIKVSRVAGLKDDIAYALAATDVRVQAPIPGKTAVGVEVPNLQANYVALGDIYGPFPPHASPMAFWLGKDVTGKAVLADLVKMVHLLVAGTTGSGKSGCLNALITSILLRATPDDVRMVMIDPKKVELSAFDGLPHLLAPVVTSPKQATYVLDNLCREMDRRYEVLRANGYQDIRGLNRKRARAGEEPLPYIMVIVDELADLMMAAPSEVEDSIIRLGQLGRSSGVHLVVATQRPSVDVVTGMIKTNIPSRIAFAVSSQTDSRIILDQGGAESLLGMGDMLFSPMGSSRLLRVQGALVSGPEMKLLTGHWRQQATPEFRDDLLEKPAAETTDAAPGGGGDPLLGDAIRTVVHTGAASVALLQRRLRVGYARAGRLIDMLEEMGIISGFDGSKARNVLITEDEVPARVAALDGEATGEDPAAEEPVAARADADPGMG